jgi:hypothetical protein
MAGGQRLISWFHPCSTSNVALNTRTNTHGPLMGHRVPRTKPTCLSTPGGPPAQTFHVCSSPAPTQIKPQHAPATLGQESVHTTLLIIITKEWPSTGPRTTQVLSTLFTSVIWLAFLPQSSERNMKNWGGRKTWIVRLLYDMKYLTRFLYETLNQIISVE